MTEFNDDDTGGKDSVRTLGLGFLLLYSSSNSAGDASANTGDFEAG